MGYIINIEGIVNRCSTAGNAPGLVSLRNILLPGKLPLLPRY
jgi:hypothetical protein